MFRTPEETVELVESAKFPFNDSEARKEMSSERVTRQLTQNAELSAMPEVSESTSPDELMELSPNAGPEELAAASDSSPKSRGRTRLSAAVMYALSSVIPFLVLLYIIHVVVFSGKSMNAVWVSCLALIALGIALLGWKLMKEAWGKLSRAVETIEDLRGESDHLNRALQMKEAEDEIDRIPFVVNHLAEIAKQQRLRLEGYRLKVRTLSSKIEEGDRELQKVRREDRLTRLFNPQYFADRARYEVARTRRYERDLALAMIEVDSFKEYEESAGHRAADEALASIGAIIRKSIRETDLPFRVGDDQFAIVFPETTAGNAMRALERVRAAVEKLHLKKERTDASGTLTLSVGVSMIGKSCTDLERFVAAADEALQEVKAAGGNKIAMLAPV